MIEMIERLSEQQQRLVAVGLLALCIGIAYLALLEPWLDLSQSYERDLEKKRRDLTNYQTKAGNREIFQRQVEQIRKQLGKQQAGYLKGKTQALAAAEMQDHVKRIIEAGAGRLTSIQILQEQKQDETKSRVTIKVQLTGTIETVHKVFHTLESGQPRVFLDNVYVRAKSGYVFRPGQAQADQLDIRFDLYGFLQPL